MRTLIETTSRGLYCPHGDFYIDPSKPVERAVLTHAHSDHARPGSREYFCTLASVRLMEKRLGRKVRFQTKDYGEGFDLGGARVSFYPAGHILGSAQVCVEAAGERWVVSGDYKRDADPTCAPFEVVECDTFISEATFALPIYQWEPGKVIARDVFEWWERNRAQGRTSVLFVYSVGKAQRILGELASLTDRRVLTHPSVEELTQCYRDSGIQLLPTEVAQEDQNYRGELVLAPPSVFGGRWLRRFGEVETGFASGWMRVRRGGGRRSYHRGFALSDHADWPALLRTIADTRAPRVLLMHGGTEAIVRYLRERGVRASTLGEGEGVR